MAGEADRLVDEIRLRRERFRTDLVGAVPGRGAMQAVRERPALWIVGGVVAGMLVGRIWGQPMLRAGKRYALGHVRARAQTAAAGLLAAGLARFGPRPQASASLPPES